MWWVIRGMNVLLGEIGNVSPVASVFSALNDPFFRGSAFPSREIQIIIAILVAAILLTALVAHFRRRALLRGYEGHAEELREIVKFLKGRIYRQYDDLMLEGIYHQWPVFIRFSHSSETPGLYIQIPVPTRLTLFVVPVKLSDKHQAGKTVLLSSDEQFDARVVIRSDQPIQARVLFSAGPVLQQLPQLCCSSNTLVSMATGLLEVSEPLIPKTDLSYHVVSHIRGMAKIAAEAAKLEGAPKDTAKESKTKANRFLRIAIVAAVVVLIALFFINRFVQPSPPHHSQIVPAGIAANDAALIPGVDHWRLAGTTDFDSQGVTWLQSRGGNVSGHIVGRFAGETLPKESAYVLISDDGRQPPVFRIVVLINQAVRFDKTYSSMAVVATVRKSDLAGIVWKGAPPLMPADGDGILIVSNYDDPGSASIVFTYGTRMLLSGTPADFRTVSIQ